VVDKLYRRVSENTPYAPEFGVLPAAFVRRASDEEKVESLKFHAEKKALAMLLMRGAEDLDMSINFSVCADCRAFLAHSAQSLGRQICVHEPSRVHVFDESGRCSTAERGDSNDKFSI
jgi:hypothetical protein